MNRKFTVFCCKLGFAFALCVSSYGNAMTAAQALICQLAVPAVSISYETHSQKEQIRIFHGDMRKKFETLVEKDENKPMNGEKKIKTTGGVFFVVHPERGLIAMDGSGLEMRLSHILGALKAREIQTILTFSDFNEKGGAILITNSGIAYQLKVDAVNSTQWPVLKEHRLLIHEVNGDPNHLESYRFVDLAVQTYGAGLLTLVRYDHVTSLRAFGSGEFRSGYNRVEELALKVPIQESGEKNLVRFQVAGRSMYVFPDGKGFEIFDPEASAGLIIKKMVNPGGAIAGLIDFEDENRIAVITSSGDISLIDRNDFFDSSKPLVKFLEGRWRAPKNGDAFYLGQIFGVHKISRRAARFFVPTLGSLYSSEKSFFVQDYTLKLNSQLVPELVTGKGVSFENPTPRTIPYQRRP